MNMQKVKGFFYVSLGILALAAAFHLGAQKAQSQSGSEVVRTEVRAGERNYVWVITKDGGAYLIAAPFVDGQHVVKVLAKGSIHQTPRGEGGD
jgi:hypothetical protein